MRLLAFLKILKNSILEFFFFLFSLLFALGFNTLAKRSIFINFGSYRNWISMIWIPYWPFFKLALLGLFFFLNSDVMASTKLVPVSKGLKNLSFLVSHEALIILQRVTRYTHPTTYQCIRDNYIMFAQKYYNSTILSIWIVYAYMYVEKFHCV